MDGRSLYVGKNESDYLTIVEGASAHVRYAMPIITEGDVVGCIASLSNDSSADNTDSEAKLIQTAASFLGKQFEG